MENNDTIFTELEPTETEASALQSFFIRLIDFIVDVALLILLIRLLPQELVDIISGKSSILMFAVFISVVILSRFILLVFFNKTAGMMVCRVKQLNAAMQPLTTKEKLLSLFRTRFSKIKYYKEK